MIDIPTTASSSIYEKQFIVNCLYCAAKKTVKYGKRICKKGLVQIYFCKLCNRRFTIKDGFRRMKHSKKIITAALDLYAKGVSLRGVSQHLKMFYNKDISHVAILYWIRNYGKLLKTYSETLKPKTSKKWYSDETAMHFNNRKNWEFIIMDSKTRFMIGHETSLWKNENGCRRLFEKVAATPIEKPEVIATDGAQSLSKNLYKLSRTI